jgi:hypothetical protein
VEDGQFKLLWLAVGWFWSRANHPVAAGLRKLRVNILIRVFLLSICHALYLLARSPHSGFMEAEIKNSKDTFIKTINRQDESVASRAGMGNLLPRPASNQGYRKEWRR